MSHDMLKILKIPKAENSGKFIFYKLILFFKRNAKKIYINNQCKVQSLSMYLYTYLCVLIKLHLYTCSWGNN